MMRCTALLPRNFYLERLIGFQDTEPVKVITGIRRCGKSSLMKLMVNHLLEAGILREQIIEMNFESYDFYRMTEEEIYRYVKSHIVSEKRMYLFFDEIQRVSGWENAINAFRVDFNCDIYVTGSDAKLLSSEYSTYLSGRYIEIKMLPLSFREFCLFHGYKLESSKNPFGGKIWKAIDKNDEQIDIRDVFYYYTRFGGMPGIADIGLNQEKALILLDGIYSTIIVRDIMAREARRGQKRISSQSLLHKIVLFLADNIGSNVSASSIGDTLANEGLLDAGKRRGVPSAHTVQAYVEALVECCFFYEIKRFDIKGREYLRTLGKYYIADLGLRNFLLGFRDRDRGHALENIVFFELLRRGWDVAVGKIGSAEVDFVATKTDSRLYVQVAESMLGEDVRNREFGSLQQIRDNHPKMVLSLDPGPEPSCGGIASASLLDWLLAE